MCTFLYLDYQLVDPRLTRSAAMECQLTGTVCLQCVSQGLVTFNNTFQRRGQCAIGQQFQNTAFEEMYVPVDLPEKSQRSRKTAQRRR